VPVHLIGSGARGVFDIASTCTFHSLLHVGGTATRADDAATLADLAVDCPRRGRIDGKECVACQHLHTWQIRPRVQVSCTVDDGDTVEAWMRRKPPATTVEAHCHAADQFAAARGVHHLLVFDRKLALAGLACRCDLARGIASDDAVAAVMSSDVFAVEPTITLGVAATAMRELRLGCLPVVAGPLVIGILTRRDLDRAGVPATWDPPR
jgi:CBS-domain-containing membrane protein